MDRTALSTSRSDASTESTHLIRLESAGMTALAETLLQSGQSVSASVDSDFGEMPMDRLKALGLRVHQGHASRNPLPQARRLIHPIGMPVTNHQRLSALGRNIEQVSMHDALDELLGPFATIAVFGGRIARVAATMIGWILTHSGQDPTLILEAEIPDRLSRGRFGRGTFAVLDLPPEAIQWTPEGTCLAVVLDVRPTPEEGCSEAFDPAHSMSADRAVLRLAEAGGPIELSQASGPKREQLSLNEGHDWWGADLRPDRGRYRFRVFYQGEFVLEVKLTCPGRRYVIGALAAIAACRSIDLDIDLIREALEEFQGISRGFDLRGTYRGVTLIDDDAVEASDVAETLSLARMIYGRRRIWAVYSSTSGGSLPGSCLTSADQVLSLGQCSDPLRDKTARQAADREEALWNLDQHLEPGDVLVTLGAAEMGTIADAFIRRLPRDRQDR